MSNIPAAQSKGSLIRVQASASKTTYQAGVAMLFSSAKESIGCDEVHAVCEAMVQAYFFRFEPADADMGRLAIWILSSDPPVKHMQLLDISHSAAPEHDSAFKAHLTFTEKIAKLAGITMDTLTGLLRAYLSIFQWEMKQRDFKLVTSYEVVHHPYMLPHKKILKSVMHGWRLEKALSC